MPDDTHFQFIKSGTEVNDKYNPDVHLDQRYFQHHTTNVHFLNNCSPDDVQLVADREMYILSSRHDPDEYSCTQRFEASNATSVLHLTCFMLDLRFNCQYEFLKIKVNNNIHTLCSGNSPPIFYSGQQIDLDYERKLFGLHGGYTCSLIAVPFMSPEDLTLDCGISSNDIRKGVSLRVVNGNIVKRSAFPWMTIIKADTEFGNYFCGGTLVSNEIVITSAHCLKEHVKEVEVGLGKIDLSDLEEKGSLWLTATNFTVHPQYDNLKLINDIGLIFLPEKIQFTHQIKPACLPSFEMTGDIGGYSATVLGWGSTEYNGKKSSLLRKAELYIWKNKDCQKIWKKEFEVEIQTTEICALGEDGKDTCDGDSGGPLLVKLEDRWVLVGITSYGFKCSKPGLPGVYTRLSKYKSWLDNFL